jgi:hypothetical protein
MIQVKEIMRWLSTLDHESYVGVDEGGLILLASRSDAFLEIGGMPDPEGDAICESLKRQDSFWRTHQRDVAKD